jgi:hypothetical protein
MLALASRRLAAQLPLVAAPRPAPAPAARPALADPAAWALLDWAAARTGERYVAFEVPGAPGSVVVVRRGLLRAARTALRFARAELRCTVEADAVRLSWHGGRGGLVLRTVVAAEAGRIRDGRVMFEVRDEVRRTTAAPLPQIGEAPVRRLP